MDGNLYNWEFNPVSHNDVTKFNIKKVFVSISFYKNELKN